MAAIKKMIDQLMSGAPQLLKPEGLHASNISDHDIVLAWEQVPDATGYQISRNGNNLTPEPIPDQTFHEAGLSSGTTYEYSVIARAGSSSSPPSTIQVTTTGNPPPLAAPELSTSDLTATSIKLSWTSLSGASGYQVFRNGANFINVTENTYTDTGLTEQTTYTYTVLGHTAEGLLGPHSNGFLLFFSFLFLFSFFFFLFSFFFFLFLFFFFSSFLFLFFFSSFLLFFFFSSFLLFFFLLQLLNLNLI